MSFLDLIFQLFTPAWAKFVNIGINVWNKSVQLTLQLLVMNPSAVGGGAAWRLMRAITESVLYRAVASTLVVSFFLYGISKSALDFGRNFDLKALFFHLVPMVVAETILLNFCSLIYSFFQAVSALIVYTVGTTGTNPFSANIPAVEAFAMAADMGFMESVLVSLLGFIAMLVMIFCAISLILVAYNRFFKVLLLIPMGCFSLPAAAAGTAISGHNPASGYIRTFVVYLLEALAVLFTIFITASLLADADIFGAIFAADEFGHGIAKVLDILLVASATTALAKGAEQLMQRIFG